MTWTRLSDDFTDRPAMLTVSRDARLLHIEAMVWCNRMLTDGSLPTAAIRRLTDSPDPDAAIDELVGVELWHPTDVGWDLDWADQEAGDEVRKRRDANAERQRKFRRRRELHNAGDHSECDTRHCVGAARVTGQVTRYETPSRPDPSRPVPTEREGRRQGAAQPRSARAPRARDLKNKTDPLPHEFAWSPADPNDHDEESPSLPCHTCGHQYLHLTHHAHTFIPSTGTDPPDRCDECYERPTNPVHHYQPQD